MSEGTSVDPPPALVPDGASTLTREGVSALVRARVLEVLEGFIKSDLPPCPDTVSRAVLECARKALPPAVQVEVVPLSEEEKMVREVMEEPADTIEIRATIPTSLEYIIMTLDIP